MPKPSNGFILGAQRIFAGNHGKASRSASADRNSNGSWWVGVPRDQWGAKCAEVFPEVADSREGQKPARMNFSR